MEDSWGLQMFHLPLNTGGAQDVSHLIHTYLSNSAEIRLVSSSGNFGPYIYLTTGGGQDACNGQLNPVVSLWN